MYSESRLVVYPEMTFSGKRNEKLEKSGLRHLVWKQGGETFYS